MWRKFSRSELLSTFFPTWIWQGREWSKGRIPKYDPYFWINAHSHPVICSYYPISIIGSILAAKLSLDKGFELLLFLLFLHTCIGFYGWFLLVSYWSNMQIAFFGAITFSLAGYNWKQQPCIQYTLAWFPWLLIGITRCDILLTSVSFGMILLAGYYPIGVQLTLIAAGASVLWGCSLIWIPIGFLIGSPQLIPFLRYLPKTIRTHKVSTIGKVPWWHPITLIFPSRKNINGVGFWEMSYYVGITPLFLIFYSNSIAWILALTAYLLMIGLFSDKLPRIPARWCFTFQFAIGWMAVIGLTNLHLTEKALICLIVIQIFDLIWHNSDLIPTLPYSELYNKPSRAFSSPLVKYLEANLGEDRVSGLPYPLFTGHINKFKTLGYSGGMQLKLMAKWRNDGNPDGSGEHDYFRRNTDDGRLSQYRVKFAYSRKGIDRWLKTPIKHLYKNPEYN